MARSRACSSRRRVWLLPPKRNDNKLDLLVRPDRGPCVVQDGAAALPPTNHFGPGPVSGSARKILIQCRVATSAPECCTAADRVEVQRVPSAESRRPGAISS